MLSLKRARPHASIFAAVAAVMALSTGTILAILCALAVAADEGVRRDLALRSGSDLAVRVTLPLDRDSAAQDAVVMAAIDRTFAGVSPAPRMKRTVTAGVSLGSSEQDADDNEREIDIIGQEELIEAASLKAGRWASVGEATIQADSAADFGLEIGSVIVAAGEPVTLVGTWRVDDPLDPRWLSDAGIIYGRGPTPGPLAVPGSTWDALAGESGKVEWTVIPDAASLTAHDLDNIAQAWPSIRTLIPTASGQDTRLSTSGGLVGTASTQSARVGRVRAIAPVVVVLILVATVVTIIELARFMASRRSAESTLLWSRGRSATEVGLGAGLEAGIAAAAGALVGVIGGALIGSALGARGGDLLPPAVPVLAAGVVVVAAIGFGATAARSSRPDSADQRAGRIRGAVTPTVTAAVVLAAALAVWQLKLYARPVTAPPDSGSAADPAAVVAPTLALVAVVLVLLHLVYPAARAWERRSSRTGVARWLAARSFARRLPRVVAAIAVIAVAVGALATAAAYKATWQAAFERSSAVRAGAEVQAVAASGGFDVTTIDRVIATPAVTAAYPVQLATLQLSDSTGSLVAVDPAAFAALAPTERAETTSLATALEVEGVGPVIPERVDRLRLEVAITGFATDPHVWIYVIADSGRVLRIPAGITVEGDPGTEQRLVADVEIPPAAQDGSSRIVAMDVSIDEEAIPGGEARFGPLVWVDPVPGFDTTGWISQVGGVVVTATPLEDGGFTAGPGVTDVRLIPKAEAADATSAPPVAISAALAERLSLSVGDRISFGIERVARFNGVIAAVVETVPSSDDPFAVMLDLTVLQQDALRGARSLVPPTSLWIAADDPDVAAREVRAQLPPGSVIRTAGDPAGRVMFGATAGALWAAAVVCALLSLITMVGVAGSERRARMAEIGVLRALGARARDQASMRRVEWAIAIAAGTGAGLIAGAVVIALTITDLADAAVPAAFLGLGAPVRIDLVASISAIGLLVLGCAVIAESAAGGVRRDAARVRGLGGDG